MKKDNFTDIVEFSSENESSDDSYNSRDHEVISESGDRITLGFEENE